MAIFAILPLITFLLFWLWMNAHAPTGKGEIVDLRKPLIQAGLVWSAFLVIGTELLSLMRGLTALGLVIMWAGAVICLAVIGWRTGMLSVGAKNLRKACKHLKLSWFDWLMVTVALATLIILLITGILSPPNIHDILAYHMSRVMHWIQNQSLSFYPTSMTWQLWMPPFSEFTQLHWQILTGGDYLSSFQQWCSLLLTMAAVSLAAKRLGAAHRGQWLAALFVLTLPIVVLQVTGGKNDVVLAFAFSGLVFYVIEAYVSDTNWMDWGCAGIAVGIGMLTKGTFLFFALPLLIWLLVMMLMKGGWRKTLTFAGIGFAAVSVLNGGHWVRNWLGFGNPVYTGNEQFLINGYFGWDVTLSNLSRHAAVQMNGKYGLINEAVQKALARIHEWINLPLFDPQLTHGPAEFYYVPTREEVAGNPFHFALSGLMLILAPLGLIRKQQRQSTLGVIALALCGLAGAVIFSSVFRWQSWSTRFFIPYYVIFAPVFGIIFGKWSPKIVSWVMAGLLLVMLINPLLNNYSRSFSWSPENRNSIWHMSRRGLRFANNQNIEGAVLELTHLMEVSGCRTYGLLIRQNAPEYLLWGTLTPGSNDYHIEHVAVENTSSAFADPNFDPCGIVLFEVTETDFIYEEQYQLTKRWQIGETYPFSLFLKPAYVFDEMD